MDRPGVVDRDQDPEYEPVEAPEPATLPDSGPAYDGDRGYEPMQPRSGIRELLRKIAAPFVGLGSCSS